MPEQLRRKAAAIAAALSLTLTAAIAVAWQGEPPAERRLASGAQAGHGVALLEDAPAPDRPPLLPPSAPAPEAQAPAPPAEATALRGFDACDDLLHWIRGTAEALVTPYGLPGRTGVGSGDMVGGGAGRATSGGAAGGGDASGGAPEAAPATSSTNVQEAGIDEPDIAKQAGGLLVAVGPAGVHIVDVAARPARLHTTLPLPRGWDHQLLLHGRRLLITSTGVTPAAPDQGAADRRFAPHPMGTVSTLLTTYDLADPAAPRLVGELQLDGGLVSSREQDGMVRLVLRGSRAPGFVTPRDHSPEAERDALERNRQIVRASSLRDWLPAVQASSRPDRPGAAAPLPGCGQVLRAGPVHSLDMATVVTVSLADPLRPLGATSVVGAGDIVYASRDRVYVTHLIPSPPPHQPSTGVHVFDTTDPRRPRHAASGAVPGMPLNQWALSEHGGHLRIATTEFRPDGSSESAVRVLALGDGVLRETGSVGGLGKGERIFAVRYDGATAYVVTFRQTDPLYTLDLSDPARPRMLGELKIPGFSRYLHPIGDGLLLGIGQDADEEGRQRGLQVSVFDVRDLSEPRRVSQVSFGGTSHSAAEHDHHALLWWGPLRRLVIPLTNYPSPQERDAGSGGAAFNGAVSIAVDGQGQAAEAARLDTSQGGGDGSEGGTVRRVFARGDELLVLTADTLVVAGMDRLDPRARVEFPRPSHQQPEPRPALGRG